MPEWTFDLTQVTRKQYNDWRRGRQTDEEDDALLARVTGLPVETIQGMSVLESKALIEAFVRKVREPLANPNSAAPSSTP